MKLFWKKKSSIFNSFVWIYFFFSSFLSKILLRLHLQVYRHCHLNEYYYLISHHFELNQRCLCLLDHLLVEQNLPVYFNFELILRKKLHFFFCLFNLPQLHIKFRVFFWLLVNFHFHILDIILQCLLIYQNRSLFLFLSHLMLT